MKHKITEGERLEGTTTGVIWFLLKQDHPRAHCTVWNTGGSWVSLVRDTPERKQVCFNVWNAVAVFHHYLDWNLISLKRNIWICKERYVNILCIYYFIWWFLTIWRMHKRKLLKHFLSVLFSSIDFLINWEFFPGSVDWYVEGWGEVYFYINLVYNFATC